MSDVNNEVAKELAESRQRAVANVSARTDADARHGDGITITRSGVPEAVNPKYGYYVYFDSEHDKNTDTVVFISSSHRPITVEHWGRLFPEEFNASDARGDRPTDELHAKLSKVFADSAPGVPLTQEQADIVRAIAARQLNVVQDTIQVWRNEFELSQMPTTPEFNKIVGNGLRMNGRVSGLSKADYDALQSLHLETIETYAPADRVKEDGKYLTRSEMIDGLAERGFTKSEIDLNKDDALSLDEVVATAKLPRNRPPGGVGGIG